MDNEPNFDGKQPLSRVSRNNMYNQQHKNKPKKTRLRVFRIFLVALGALGIILGVTAARTYNRIHDAVDKTFSSAGVKKSRNVSAALSKGEPFTVLLMGTDTGELGRSDGGRTDSLMLMTVNPKQKKTTLMSIPRDTVIAPVGYETEFPQKMNSAYEFGKEATTMKTVQNWLNIPIDYYGMVNMRGMEDVVNEVGGIQVESPLTFKFNPTTAHADSGYNYGHSDPGDLYSFTKGSTTYGFNKNATDEKYTYSDKMNGAAALAFSRMRYDDPQGDYGRTQRQRLVLQAIMTKAKSNPTRLVNQSFLNTISKNARTDLTYDDMMAIVKKYLPAANKIVTDHIQGGGQEINGVSYEHVTRSEQQRATNVLRKSLGLKKAKAGPLYAGKISDYTIESNGLTTAETEEASTN
ncbi:LytR family transcriptional regulator [Weissella coleopterorum]|uniref:LytR family transcriptional regulator n=1 Tax=Weissella coleopterorum TaxID=2714949 RepID=A0A6G8AYE2_9LACO|nr:LCP family protein [Weissella coleopterorum]QIL49972.1 LytR family transcriptional regulator [Weissella coleopterorum]